MLLIMGIAGSGKGTQGKQLARLLKLTYLSTGDILRANATAELKEKLLTGKLLDDDEIIGMVEVELNLLANPDAILLDGFPRSMTQARWISGQISSRKLVPPTIIKLDVSPEVARDRLLKRARSDDVPDTISERFDEFEQVTLPILSFFESIDYRIIEIDGNRPSDEVFKAILKGLQATPESTVNANES